MYRFFIGSKDVISPLCMEEEVYVFMYHLCIIILIGIRLIRCACDDMVLVLEVTGQLIYVLV